MSEDVLERIQDDIKSSMRAGDRQRTAALRVVASAVQSAAKDGEADPVPVLQRERKKRIEAAEAFADAGREEQAEAERAEATLIDDYLPEQISDDELTELIDRAVAETGADSMQQMGQVIGAVMSEVKGRADGKRVSAAVRERLGA